VLALVPEFIQATRAADALPIHIAISYDEEIGCVGVRGLLDELSRDAARPQGCIIGEPTMMKVATAHKGKSAWRCSVHGQAAHSSQPDLGVNAIEVAAELVTFLRQQGREWQNEPGDGRYNPPWSTVQVGTIKGGSAVNVVPDHCEFDFEIRSLPDSPHQQLPQVLEDWAQQQLLPDMRRVSADADIRLLPQVAYPALKDDPSMSALKQQCAGALAPHPFESVAFGTEAGLFQQAGIPTVICGPGSITQAHKADEYIDIAQLALCQTFLRKIVGAG
jgi:acetylornithine deacetylase